MTWKIWNTSGELIEWLNKHHAPMHEDGGVDEIDLTGLSGTSADLTTHVAAADPHAGYVLESLFDADTFLYAPSDNTPVATSPANVLAALTGHAGAAFSWNSQNLTSVGSIGCGDITISGSPTYGIDLYGIALPTADIRLNNAAVIRGDGSVIQFYIAELSDYHIEFGAGGNVPSIFGTGAYLRIGDDATTQHSLDSEDDLMVTGELEVVGATFLDSGITLGAKLTGGANEIEGSNFDINGGDIAGTTWQTHTFTLTGNLIRSGAHSLTLITTATTSITLPTSGTLSVTTHTHALAAGATDVTATAAELNLLDLAGLTAGEVLVATAATTAAWQSTGVKLSAPDISGTVTAATTLTMPAITLNGTVTINGQNFGAGSGYVEIDTTGKVGLLMDGGICTGGATVLGRVKNAFGGNFLSDGGATWAVMNRFHGALTGADGDTAFLLGTLLANEIITQNQSQTIGYVAQVRIDEPVITKGNDTVTLAATLYISGAPSEGASNYNIYCAAGNADLGASCEANAYTVGGVAGIDFNGAVTNLTVVKGIVTAAS